MNLKLLSPQESIVDVPIKSLKLPLHEGEATILPGHTAYLAKLGCGTLEARADAGDLRFFVSGGYMEVDQQGSISVLVDVCEAASDIDSDRAKQALERAQKRIFDKQQVNIDIARALYAKKRAESRIHTASL